MLYRLRLKGDLWLRAPRNSRRLGWSHGHHARTVRDQRRPTRHPHGDRSGSGIRPRSGNPADDDAPRPCFRGRVKIRENDLDMQRQYASDGGLQRRLDRTRRMAVQHNSKMRHCSRTEDSTSPFQSCCSRSVPSTMMLGIPQKDRPGETGGIPVEQRRDRHTRKVRPRVLSETAESVPGALAIPAVAMLFLPGGNDILRPARRLAGRQPG